MLTDLVITLGLMFVFSLPLGAISLPLEWWRERQARKELERERQGWARY